MKEDEARHGQTAMDAGGRELPAWAQKMMRLTSKVMTRGAYWL
jgi:ubiquinone biosynthesis monooxygenase Coq7